MTNIKLVTRFNIINHGSILQTIATQEFFKTNGYDVEVINYINKKEKFPRIIKESLKQNNSWNKNVFKRIIYFMIKYPSGLLSHIKFSKYRKRLLNLTKEYNSEEELKKDNFSNCILCSGSDQLWGPIIDGNLDSVYFCSFYDTKKIAFSSSIGRSVDFDEKYINYLKDFTFITTREESASKYLSEYVDDCCRIYDPTLMINEEYWYNFADKKKEKNKYILLYRIHNNPEFEKHVKEISKEKKIKVIRITNSLEDIFMYGVAKVNIKPEKFLSLIRDAEYVLTDSFHCTLFSLIFKKKFVTISPGKTAVRISDFLEEFDLTHHLVDNSIKEEILNENIDYKKIFSIIHFNRKKYKDIVLKNMEKLK